MATARKSSPRKSTATAKPPWEKGNPKAKAGKSKKLTSTQKSAAKASAKKAGRPYPSLVDNMNAAKKKKAGAKKTTTKKSVVKKSATKKPAARKSTATKKKPGPKKTAAKSK